MASPNVNNPISWSDITDLFNKLNSVRSQWKYSSVAISGGAGTVINQDILPTVESYIEEMNNYTDSVSGKKHIQIGRDLTTGVNYPNAATVDYVIPSVSDLITPAPLTAYFTTLNRVANVCSFNGGFFSSCFGFNNGFQSSFNNGFQSSFDSSDFTSCFGFDSSDFTTCFSFDGFNTGGFQSGFKSSNFTSCFSNKSADFSSHDGSFKSSNNGSDFGGNHGWKSFSCSGFFSGFSPKSSFY